MPNPIIDFAPATTHGVSSLMAVGADAPEGPPAIYFDAGRALKFAAVGGAIGLVRRRTLSYALGGAAVSLLMNVFGK